MCLDRRHFFKLSAAGIALASMSESLPSMPIPQVAQDEIKNLQPLTSGVQKISTAEYLARQEQARKYMREAKMDAIFVAGGASMRYFTGMDWGQSERTFGFVLPAKGEIAWVTPKFEQQRAEEQIKFGKDIRAWEEDGSPYTLIIQIMKDRNAAAGTLGIEEQVRYFQSNGIARVASGLRIVPCSSEVTARCRSVKSAHELELLSLANRITLKAYEVAFKTLREGLTQFELSTTIAAAHRALGAPGGAGVQFGEYTAFPHGSATPQKLKEGEVVMVDGGCRVEGYSSDITRTTVFGKPTDRQKKVWEVEKRAQEAALAAAQPGVECQAVDAAARQVVTDAGFGPGYKYFTHRVGHGIGLEGHEWFYLVKGNRRKLEPGMTFSDEPGIYIQGEFGMRLEDCMYITEEGAKLFTPASPALERPFA